MSAVEVGTRPLEGRRIAVTRPRAQAGRFAGLLEAAGAAVLAIPTIAIDPPETWAPLDASLGRLAGFSWVVFTSANGVAMVRDRLDGIDRGAEALRACRIAAIGPATAEALAQWGVPAELVPEAYVAESLAAALSRRVRPGDRVLLPRAADTRDVLVRALTAMGAVVEEVPAYRTRAAAEADDLRTAVRSGRVDMVTFTSSSTVRHFAALFAEGELGPLLHGVAVACIGPVTAATAAALGLRAEVVPEEYTIAALARAIVRHYEREGPRDPVP